MAETLLLALIAGVAILTVVAALVKKLFITIKDQSSSSFTTTDAHWLGSEGIDIATEDPVEE